MAAIACDAAAAMGFCLTRGELGPINSEPCLWLFEILLWTDVAFIKAKAETGFNWGFVDDKAALNAECCWLNGKLFAVIFWRLLLFLLLFEVLKPELLPKEDKLFP